MLFFLGVVSARAQSRSGAPAAAEGASQNQTAPIPASSVPSAGVERAKIDPAKEADIRRLMDVMGAKALIREMKDGMGKNMRSTMAGSLPPGDYRDKLVDLFIEKFQSRMDAQQFIDMAVPIYDKYLSDEEIKGLTAFYQTPLGQKTSSVLPKLTVEVQAEGTKWGQQTGRQCMLEVLSEHPELTQALAAAGKASRPQ
jgi:hypothetical protein